MGRLATRSWLLPVLIGGLVLGALANLLLDVVVGPVIGWVAAAVVVEVIIWSAIGRADAQQTADRAAQDDPTNQVIDLLLLVANVVSLGMIAYAIVASGSDDDDRKLLVAALALLSAAVSWLLVQTLFTLRYAALYYDASPPGGIDFNGPQPPNYIDFAYLAFSMGMTYQVSDTNLQTHEFRALVLRHGLTSYVFGTVILATTINLVVSVSAG